MLGAGKCKATSFIDRRRGSKAGGRSRGQEQGAGADGRKKRRFFIFHFSFFIENAGSLIRPAMDFQWQMRNEK
jgi:hypothetical protein